MEVLHRDYTFIPQRPYPWYIYTTILPIIVLYDCTTRSIVPHLHTTQTVSLKRGRKRIEDLKQSYNNEILIPTKQLSSDSISRPPRRRRSSRGYTPLAQKPPPQQGAPRGNNRHPRRPAPASGHPVAGGAYNPRICQRATDGIPLSEIMGSGRGGRVAGGRWDNGLSLGILSRFSTAVTPDASPDERCLGGRRRRPRRGRLASRRQPPLPPHSHSPFLREGRAHSDVTRERCLSASTWIVTSSAPLTGRSQVRVPTLTGFFDSAAS